MRSRIRIMCGITISAGLCMLMPFLPAYAQTPTVPQQVPSGTTSVQPSDEVNSDVGADTVGPANTEAASVTSSDPSVVSVSLSGGTFISPTISYDCKKAGVAVVTVTLKSGAKYVKLVGCGGVRFPLQTIDYTKGLTNSHSYLCWVDAKGTLVCSGVYVDKDGKTMGFNISIPNYQAATPPPPKPQPPKPAPTPSQAPPNTNGGGD